MSPLIVRVLRDWRARRLVGIANRFEHTGNVRQYRYGISLWPNVNQFTGFREDFNQLLYAPMHTGETMSESHKAQMSTNDTTHIDQEVSHAYALLCDAEKKSIRVPNDVVLAITGAHTSTSRTGRFSNCDSETRFWNAYGLLSSIGPTDEATSHYKFGFYMLLVLLLCFQLYFLAGSLILSHLGTIETEWQHVADSASAATQGGEHSNAELWNRLRRTATAKANYDLAQHLMPFFQEPKLSEEFFDDYKGKMPREKVQFMVNYIKLKGELELHVLALSGYILPFLYGALGAFAFLLRKLSDPMAKLTYAHDARMSCTLRLHVGALAGLAVGWFINSNSSNFGLGTLSPLALAFAAGYASDLLFTALDKVVGAFNAPANSQNGKTELTPAGKAMRTGLQRRARVPSGSVSTPIEASQHVCSIDEGEITASSVHEVRMRAV
jgi:hypothetical protein